MENNRITLMDAYMIETLRGNGISDGELLDRLEQKDIDSWKNLKPSFDFSELIKLYDQNPSTFSSILSDGYTVKFITMKGLQNLLNMKFDKIEERDYQLTGNGISHLTIEEGVYPALKQLLSSNWVIQELSEHNASEPTQLISILLV
ncbi:hypothetical protein [Sporosarcina psychrophila]|uniref:hypothetical protein n=1 Tax=Sporosarcina psychrophila TaxID=1476 RepID=UPI00078CCC7F|nr:hypothetical protein [Sporosarcina psychrophila]AMQ07719.1 hypothetical protein AZE41_18220 [Sporosarcina psychrophila]